MNRSGCFDDFMKTASGVYFDLKIPTVDMVSIFDIGCSLSNQCRFNGHVPGRYYSVAEHSVICSKVAESDGIPWDGVFAVLMHDAHEAYCGDVHKPLKNLLEGFGDIEDRFMDVVADKYEIDFKKWEPIIKEIDLAVLIAEKRFFHKGDGVKWNGEDEVRKIDVVFHCHQPSIAYDLFMGRFARVLSGGDME